MLQLTLK